MSDLNNDIKEIIETGKTVEEATERALSALGITRFEADIEILSRENKGFLGLGSSLAKVKVTEKMTPEKTGAKYLADLLRAMNVNDFNIETIAGDDNINYVVISPQDMGFAIGYHGDALDAISTIVSLCVTKSAGSYVKVIVDINGYREKRVAVLKEYAHKAAQKARESSYVTVANPMKPYERMILHSTVQEYSDVVSWSEGEDPRRRVIIAPISKVRKVGDKYERTDRNENSFHSRGNDSRNYQNRDNRGKDNFRGSRTPSSGRGSYSKGGPRQPVKPAAPTREKREDIPGSLYSKIDVPKKD